MAGRSIEKVRNLLDQGELSQAKGVVNELAQAHPEDAEVLYYQGLVAFRMDAYDEAMSSLEKAIQLKPEDARFYENLGKVYGMKAQHAGPMKAMLLLPKVKSTFQKALELNPDSVAALEGLFMVHLFAPSIAGGDEKKALRLLEEVSSKDVTKGHLLKAIYHMKKNEVGEASQEQLKAGQSGQDDPEVQRRVAQFFISQNDTEHALPHIERFENIRPNDVLALELRADYYTLTGDTQKAHKTLTEAVRIHPNYYPARYKLAEILMNSDQRDEAEKHFKIIITTHPDTPFAEKARKALGA